jgi:hypothetical protein
MTLEERLDLLQRLGLLERLHHLDGDSVTLFPVSSGVAMTPTALAELEAKRKQVAEQLETARKFGAAGGMIPGRGMDVRTEDEKARKQEAERIASIRAARATLDKVPT